MRPRDGQVTLVVLAKAPVPGRVKTRLTPPLTTHQAAELAAAALLDTLDTVAAAAGPAGAVVALAGDPADGARADEVHDSLRRFPVVPQWGDRLDERIVAAHLDASSLCAEHNGHDGRGGNGTLQIGMDTPGLTAADLRAASARLADRDVDAVLGPAADGGWWALGLTDPTKAHLLLGVPMSCWNTGALTRAALTGAGTRVALLPQHSDVDTWADALLTADAYPRSRFAAAVRRCVADAAEASAR